MAATLGVFITPEDSMICHKNIGWFP